MVWQMECCGEALNAETIEIGGQVDVSSGEAPLPRRLFAVPRICSPIQYGRDVYRRKWSLHGSFDE